MKTHWLLVVLLCLLPAAPAAGQQHLNPATGDIWTYFGATYGAGWGPPATGRPAAVNVKDFGAKGDNATDDLAAIQAADQYATTAGLPLFFPGGTYAVSAPLVISQNNNWICAGRTKAYFRAMNSTGDVMHISQPNVGLFHCGFTTTSIRTAGAYIKVTAAGLLLDDIYMDKPFVGLDLETGAASTRVARLTIYGSLADNTSSIGILVNSAVDESMWFSNILSSDMNVAMMVTQLNGAMECAQCDLLASRAANLSLAPDGAKVVVSFKMIGGHIDTPGPAGTNLYIGPLNGGVVNRSDFTATWFGSGPVNNIAIVTDATSTINGISFSSCESVGSAAGNGLAIKSNGGGINGISWVGGKVAGNKIGFFIGGPNITDTLITGAQIGAIGGLPANSTAGISLDPNTAYTTITGNNLIGNAILLAGGGFGNSNRIVNNVGYNPVGALPITVGASPFIYQAGPNAETVYGFGGNVSVVAQNSTPIVNLTSGPWSVDLGPNEFIQVTYTVAPTMNAMRH